MSTVNARTSMKAYMVMGNQRTVQQHNVVRNFDNNMNGKHQHGVHNKHFAEGKLRRNQWRRIYF